MLMLSANRLAGQLFRPKSVAVAVTATWPYCQWYRYWLCCPAESLYFWFPSNKPDHNNAARRRGTTPIHTYTIHVDNALGQCTKWKPEYVALPQSVLEAPRRPLFVAFPITTIRCSLSLSFGRIVVAQPFDWYWCNWMLQHAARCKRNCNLYWISLPFQVARTLPIVTHTLPAVVELICWLSLNVSLHQGIV